MDKTERVRAALEGGAVDRAPFSLFYHFREDQAAGDAMARAHIEFYRETDPDFLKVMNDNRYAPPEFAGLKSASDWRALRPAPISAECFQNQLSGLRKIRETLGNEALVIATVFNPYHDADVISEGTLADQMKAYPEAVDEGMSTIAESLARLARACIEASTLPPTEEAGKITIREPSNVRSSPTTWR
jgi:uroporphyrinogen decarboxylase